MIFDFRNTLKIDALMFKQAQKMTLWFFKKAENDAFVKKLFIKIKFLVITLSYKLTNSDLPHSKSRLRIFVKCHLGCAKISNIRNSYGA